MGPFHMAVVCGPKVHIILLPNLLYFPRGLAIGESIIFLL